MVPKAKRTYYQNPTSYTSSSLSNLKAGQICAIIGLSLGLLLFVFFIIRLIMDGGMDEMNKAFNEAWNQVDY
jgi:hypothetical protein